MTPKDVVLVTGSSGFLGSALIRRLGSGFTIAALDRAGPLHPPINAECVGMDLASDTSVREALEHVRHAYGERIASVIHLAAHSDFTGAPSPLYEEITVRGTERLLRALSDFRVEQFVFSSTVLVHRPSGPGTRISESSPVDPSWEYPASKARTERLIRERRGSMPALILRLAGIYSDRGHCAPITHQIKRIYENRLAAHFYPGDLSHGQPFVHVDDVVAALYMALHRRGELPAEETLLIGEPVTLSYGALQQKIGQLLFGERWQTHVIPKPLAKVGAWIQDRVGDRFIKPWMVDRADDHYELDIGRARSVLGWAPARALSDTLPIMVEALLEDPPAWYRQHRFQLPFRLRRKAG